MRGMMIYVTKVTITPLKTRLRSSAGSRNIQCPKRA
jgi:hypothetical protein